MSPTTNFLSHGATIPVELFSPSGTIANHAVVVIAHGSDGMVAPWAAMIRDYAGALAAKGFTAVIPYYFGGPDGTPPSQPADVFSRLAHWQITLADAIAFAKTLPHVDGSRLGLLGFSLGGFLSLRLRSSAKVVVEYFAPDLPPGGIGSATTSVPFAQIHHGEADTVVVFQNAKGIEQALTHEGTATDLHPYADAGHGFKGDHSGDSAARTLSKARTLEFIGAHL